MAFQIANRIVYKIVVDDRIIGDIILRENEDGSYYLRVISVIPEFQGRGIGQKAIAFIERKHPKALIWELITPFQSYRNHHFYEKLGYRKVGEYRQSDVLILYQYKKEIGKL